MEIKESKLENARIRLAVEVSNDHVDDEYGKVLLDVQKKADIKGFRIGKAPIELVEKKYKDYVAGETSENIVRSAYLKAIEDNGYTPVGQPIFDFENCMKGQSFTFVIEFDIPPTITLGTYKGIHVEQKSVKVTDEDIDAEIETMRDRMATITKKDDPDSKVKKGDQVTIAMKRIDDKTQEEIEAGTFTKRSLIIGKSKESWAVDDDIIGMKKDEEKTIKVKYPKDYEVEDLKGKATVYIVKVEEIFERQLPELNDEFAKSMGEFSSYDDMKTRIRENLESHTKEHTLNQAKNEILAKIVEDSTFDIPKTIVQKEMLAVFKRLQSRFGNAGKDINEFASIFGINPDELSQSIMSEAERNIKNALVLSKIAEVESLKPSEEQFLAFINTIAARNGVSQDDVVKAIEEKGSKEDIEGDLILDTAYDFIHQNASVKMLKPVSFKEYKEKK